MADTKGTAYVAVRPVWHDGTFYRPGASVPVTRAQADRLLALSAVAPAPKAAKKDGDA